MDRIKEIMNNYHNRISICLDYITNISELCKKYAKELPEGFREQFIIHSQNYIARYSEHLEDFKNGKKE